MIWVEQTPGVVTVTVYVVVVLILVVMDAPVLEPEIADTGCQE